MAYLHKTIIFLYLRYPVFSLVLRQDPAPSELHVDTPVADLLLAQALVDSAFPDQRLAGAAALEETSLRRGDSVVLDKWSRCFRFRPQG